MKKLLFIILALVFLTACANKDKPTNNIINQQENKVENKEKEKPPKTEEPKIVQEPNDDDKKIISSLDGLRHYKEQLLRIPVVVSIDNHPKARWQSGLKDAEIIYEVEVEFPYTRYIAVFLAKEPTTIGPVRSARPYIVYYALENKGIFTHVGGSSDAFQEIKRLGVKNVDGLHTNALWYYVSTGKTSPHTSYTTVKSIRDEAKKYGYNLDVKVEGYIFNEKPTKLSLIYTDAKSISDINIAYNKENTTSYIYDSKKELFFRFKDGKKHIDEIDKEQLTVQNIILIEAKRAVVDNEGRLDIKTIGTGKGYYVTMGEVIPITWKKKDEKSRTRFYFNDKEINLNPGNTWIQVTSSLNSITIK